MDLCCFTILKFLTKDFKNLELVGSGCLTDPKIMKMQMLWPSALRRATIAAVSIVSLSQLAFAQSVARQWNEEVLQAIRIDFPAPNVHARNLFHLSAVMYDAWAAYDAEAVGVFHNEAATAADVGLARDKAISFAAYRILSSRATKVVDPVTTQASYDALMTSFGYDSAIVTTSGPSPEAVGNRCAAALLARAASDGANEDRMVEVDVEGVPTMVPAPYSDSTGYAPVNPPLVFRFPGVGIPISAVNPTRWQPLSFEQAQTQNDLETSNTQNFIGAHWGYVRPFALNGPASEGVYGNLDPGTPPYLDGSGSVDDLLAKDLTREVIEFSSWLDPSDMVTIDISPGAQGNNTLGLNDGTGHALNPHADPSPAPYSPNVVLRGDYGRTIAEFWADGPSSETPPGHWNTLANEVFDHPEFVRKMGGIGATLGELEWDVKAYLAINAALHDTAVAVWGVKRHYDYVRPITLVRYMSEKGQSSDPSASFYDPLGLPLVPGLIAINERPDFFDPESMIEVLEVKAWQKPLDPPPPFPLPSVRFGLGEFWAPYQRSTFVTPAFAGYVSGHSGFSRAAAEVLTLITGDPFFPGGMGSYTLPVNGLEFEEGPATPITLQWGTYYDAADEAGISRLYGGIHFSVDDGPGRVMGSKIGIDATSKALKYIDGSILDGFRCTLVPDGGGLTISWPCVANYQYQVQSSPTPDFSNPTNLTTLVPLYDDVATYTVPSIGITDLYFRVKRMDPVAP